MKSNFTFTRHIRPIPCIDIMIRKRERESEWVKTTWVAIFLPTHLRLHHKSLHTWDQSYVSVHFLALHFLPHFRPLAILIFLFLLFFFFLLHSEVSSLLFLPITLRGKFLVCSSKLNRDKSTNQTSDFRWKSSVRNNCSVWIKLSWG